MSKLREKIAEYSEFFGEISVDEVDPQNTLNNYSLHASLNTEMLDMKEAIQDAQAQ